MKIKRASVLLIALIIALNLSVACFAKFDIDGVLHNDEWSGSEMFVIGEDTGFNNDIDFAYVRVQTDDKADIMYLCVSMFLKKVENPDAAAVELKINNGSKIILHPDGSVEADSGKYNIHSASHFDSDAKTITTEASAAIKEGFNGEIRLTVCLIDTRGLNSNTFNLLVNRGDGEGVVSSVAKSDIVTDSAKATKKSSSKTTDDFTYKKASGSADNGETASQSVQTGDTTAGQSKAESENLTSDTPDKSVQRKKLITAVGVVCAAAVVISAVTAEIIKLRKSK
ncbi:MAG: hypothetical protein ACI4RB_06350 [Acutalibacteraceae bacterium]